MDRKKIGRVLLASLLGAFVVGAPLVSVNATLPATGVASSCSGLASCNFVLTNSAGGAGYATTSAGVGGYVGQSPLAFSGGSVSFLLPGEVSTTYATGVYSGQAVLDGSSSMAGTLYATIGSFSAVDVNTGQVVKGMTNTVVGIKGTSGRGGGNTYTLISGSISITPTGQDGTTTAVTCNPSSLVSTGTSHTRCTVTVTDLNTLTPTVPTGKVTFSSTGIYGRFWSPSTHAASCTLASGSCVVYFQPTADIAATFPLYAKYGGDITHFGSSGSTELYVSAPP